MASVVQQTSGAVLKVISAESNSWRTVHPPADMRAAGRDQTASLSLQPMNAWLHLWRAADCTMIHPSCDACTLHPCFPAFLLPNAPLLLLQHTCCCCWAKDGNMTCSSARGVAGAWVQGSRLTAGAGSRFQADDKRWFCTNAASVAAREGYRLLFTPSAC